MKQKKLFLTGLLTALILTQNANAYEMQAKLDRAMLEYNNNNIGKSADILTEVSDYLRTQKALELSHFLPDMGDGWASEKSTNGGSNLMGASQARGDYTKGAEIIIVAFMTNNKLVGSMLGLLNQTSAATPDALKLYKGFVTTFEKIEETKQLVYNLYVSENLVVSIKGATLTQEQAVKFIDQIKLDELKMAADK